MILRMTTVATFAFLFLQSMTARADEPAAASTAPPAAEAAPPPPAEAAPTPAEAPPPPAEAAPPATDVATLHAFRKSYLTYDAESGVASQGQSRRELSPEELYVIVGRPELVDAAGDRRTKRTVLFVAAGVTAAAAITGGALLFASAPDRNSAYCVSNVEVYNTVCTPQYRHAMQASGAVLVSGLLVASGLLTWGLATSVEVVSPKETERMVSTYNGQLMRRLRENVGSVERPGARLEVAPQLALNGGGVTMRLTF